MTTPRGSLITWKIGGEAGFGIMSTGVMFARACMRAGWNVFTYPEYPSLIRGGHNTVQVSVSTDPLFAHRVGVDVLVALNKESVDLHTAEMNPNGMIIYDTSDRTFKEFTPTSITRPDVQVIGLPLEALAKSVNGVVLMRNTVALGASCALLGIPADNVVAVVEDMFTRKGADIVKVNTDVLMAGYNAITPEQRQQCAGAIVPKKSVAPQVLMAGNEALAYGAIQAGVQLFSGYPMTPASSILSTLAEVGPKVGVVVRHAEDEIAAIHHAIGAAYAGVRAMTATSGGGFALMTEGVGMAAMTEVGIVIVDAQRPGPSTGLPTWTEQGDLRQVLHASQGDFPRVVIAPSNHEECFSLIQEAFNIADFYQTPVIVLTDKYLAEAYRNLSIRELSALPINRGKIETAPKDDYLRYQAEVADGVAPRTLPGTANGLFLANSDEHDEFGYSNEDAPNRIAQVDRRARKITTLRKSVIKPRLIGPATAPLTVVTWGSSAGPVEDALAILQRDYQLQANAVVITMIAPFPFAAFGAATKPAQRTVIVEANLSGKLAGYIREQTGFVFDQAINRFDGRPFDAVELAKQFASMFNTTP